MVTSIDNNITITNKHREKIKKRIIIAHKMMGANV